MPFTPSSLPAPLHLHAWIPGHWALLPLVCEEEPEAKGAGSGCLSWGESPPKFGPGKGLEGTTPCLAAWLESLLGLWKWPGGCTASQCSLRLPVPCVTASGDPALGI